MSFLKIPPFSWKRTAQDSEDFDVESPSSKREKCTTSPIENFPSGYPSFSAFIGVDDTFQIYRRFTNLRSRVLLAKQDRLCILEEELQALDKAEDNPPFLGSCRMDQNKERQKLLTEIDLALSSYDESLQRDFHIRQLKTPKKRDVRSVRNWVYNKGSISRKEIQYLHCEDDLLTLWKPLDGVFANLEGWVEDRLIQLCNRFYRSHCKEWSYDRDTYIPSNRLSSHIGRGLIGFLVCILLFWPIVLCTFLKNDNARLAVVISAATVLVVFILAATSARALEVIAAAAAYAAVLTVFITQGGPTGT